MHKLLRKFAAAIGQLAMVMAIVAVNSTCYCRFYQEKMDAQLDVLKKYHD